MAYMKVFVQLEIEEKIEDFHGPANKYNEHYHAYYFYSETFCVMYTQLLLTNV